ncbi:MAG: hypothetical protein V3W37_08945 [Candidatus Binatia bacterium]
MGIYFGSQPWHLKIEKREADGVDVMIATMLDHWMKPTLTVHELACDGPLMDYVGEGCTVRGFLDGAVLVIEEKVLNDG